MRTKKKVAMKPQKPANAKDERRVIWRDEVVLRTCENKEKEGDDGHITKEQQGGDVLRRVHVLHVVVNTIKKHIPEMNDEIPEKPKHTECRHGSEEVTNSADDPDTKKERHHQ